MCNKTFLAADELAQRWGVAKQNLATMRYNGNGPIYVKIGGRIRYEMKDILAYEEAQRYSRTDTPVNIN